MKMTMVRAVAINLLLVILLLTSCSTHRSTSHAALTIDTTRIEQTAIEQSIEQHFEQWWRTHRDSLTIVIENFERDTLVKRTTITQASATIEQTVTSDIIEQADTISISSTSGTTNVELKKKDFSSRPYFFCAIFIIACVLFVNGKRVFFHCSEKGHP